MSKLKWDQIGERFFEAGVDRGVLYVMTDGQYGAGVVWNGLTAVNANPTGAEPTPLYADNIKYLNLMSVEEFAATIEAYTYPDEFEECDGSIELIPGLHVGQQDRKLFGFSYRTKIGSDVNQDLGYKINLVYNGLAAPSQKNHQTINDSPEATTLSWEVTTTPVEVLGREDVKPTATLTINSTKFTKEQMAAIENILYGADGDPEAEPPVPAVTPRLPLPHEVATILGA